MPAATVYLALGSNLGDREGHLARGLASLRDQGVRVRATSSVYETEPVGGPAQGAYLNAVVQAETRLRPEEVLASCLEVEREAGRVRSVADAPRTLDLDLLLYGDAVVETRGLAVPHPRLHERRFVLVPLAEIAPEARHPVLGLSAREMERRCPDTAAVARYGPPEILG